jgi:cephalosporin-C deacetylase-like acetyl esterase
MPIVSMPLEQHHAYIGRNAQPHRFDAYRDRALVKMRALASAVFVPYEPHVSIAGVGAGLGQR